MIDGFDRGSRVLPVRAFYLAMPPDLYAPVIERMAAVASLKELEGTARTRVVIEKPFGSDSNRRASSTGACMRRWMKNRSIESIIISAKKPCRTSWYSACQAVFEPIWNRRYVDHVQITAAENACGNPRRVLRQSRRCPRHVSKSSVAACLSYRYGAAGRLFRRRGTR